MPFNATNTNVGGHFKTSGTDQYKFVAPVAGNYYFSLSQNHSSRVDTRILKNGVDYHGGESETSSMNWWDHHHLSCVIPLAELVIRFIAPLTIKMEVEKEHGTLDIGKVFLDS